MGQNIAPSSTRRGQNRTRVSLLTSGAVFAMFGLALSLWIIDIHNVVVEVQMMLLSNFAYPLEDVYSATVQRVLHLASVENVLYAYMVHCFSFRQRVMV